MKKTVILLSAVACLALAANAQVIPENKIPVTTPPSEYAQMNEWLFSYMLNGVTPQSNDQEYGRIKQEWSNFGEQIRDKIIESFPVDPSVTSEVKNLETQLAATIQQEVAKLGFESYDKLYGDLKYEKIERTAEIDALMLKCDMLRKDFEMNKISLLQSYNDELSRRFQTAFIDAVKKLQENSTSMQ